MHTPEFLNSLAEYLRTQGFFCVVCEVTTEGGCVEVELGNGTVVPISSWDAARYLVKTENVN